MSRFAKYAWFVSGYTILVILWGAVVRATGSGAGCGNHWPACNGEVLHRPESIETMIELSHRLTSALAGFFVLIMLIWAFRAVFKHNKSLIRKMSILTFIFILIEGGLGAMLVRLELVADNDSMLRAIVVGLHLMNTLVLLGFSTLTAWAASKNEQVKFTGISQQGGLMLVGIVGFMILSAIGAVTALGDTLFPAETLAEGLRQKFDPAAHFLIQMRIWHPLMAIVVSAFLFGVGYRILNDERNKAYPQINQWVNALFAIITLQVVGGFINVILLAPVWMQIVHLLLADLMWMIIIVLTSELLLVPQEATQPTTLEDPQTVMA